MKNEDKIVINTTYGTYKYKVSNTETASNKANTIYTTRKNEENLIMYTEASNKLYIVYADLINE